MNTKKHIIIIVTILLVGLIITGSSYAFWTWTSNTSKNVIINTSDDLKNYVVYEEGDSKFSGSFEATSTFNQGMHSTISLHKTSEAINADLVATIHMNINAIGPNMASSNALKWVVTEGTSNNPGTELASGNFIGLSSGDEMILVPNITITTTETFYTIWIWLDSSENPSNNLTGETLDTEVWTEINQNEGLENVFSITDKNAYYQLITATVTDYKYKIYSYAVTTTETEPSNWTSISASDRNNIYKFSYSASSADTYYIWFKDSNNRVVHETVTVTQVDSTGPSCIFGTWSTNQIANNEAATITLTCTDSETGIDSTNLKASDITLSDSVVTINNINKSETTNGYIYTITVKGTDTDGSATLTVNNKVHNGAGMGNTSVTSPSINVINPYVATFYYNSNSTSGGLTITTATASCEANPGESCMVTIPSAVTNSVGKYNSQYAGVSKNLSSMTATRGTMSISGSTNYYAYYSSPITVYYPDSSNGVSSSNTDLYRNEYFTSTSSMNTILASSSDSTEQTESLSITGMSGSFSGVASSSNTSTGTGVNNTSVVNSDATTYYVTTVMSPYTVTFYYQSNTTSGSTTIASTSVTGGRVSYCTDQSNTNIVSEAVEIPSVVKNSVGTYNNSYYGLSESTGNMSASVSASATEVSSTNDKTYYALYSSQVTNYYVSDTESSGTYTFARTSRNLYRNQWFTSTSAMSDSVLAMNNTGTSNYDATPNTNFGTFSGLSTGDDTTSEYNSVSLAANGSANTLYTIYTLSVNLIKGNHVTNIGNTSATCLTTSTSCDVTLPSITPESGYSSIGWYSTDNTTTLNNTSTYTLTYNSATVTSGGVHSRLYANAVRIETNYEVSTNIISVSITNFTNVTSYDWRVSTSSVCDDTGLNHTTSNTYTFNVSTQGTYYVCLKMTNSDNVVTYLSREVPKMVFLVNVPETNQYASGNYYKASTYSGKIKKIQFENFVNVTGAANSWDLSETGDNSIVGWLSYNNTVTTIGGQQIVTSYYDLHIGSNYEIYSRNLAGQFANMNNVNYVNLELLHGNKITSMYHAFYQLGMPTSSSSEPFTFKLDNFNAANVTNMKEAFYKFGANHTDININFGNNFNASKITDMYMLFGYTGCSSGSCNYSNMKFNLGNNFNASNATNMSQMFVGSAFANLDLGNNFNASNVTNAYSMFGTTGKGNNIYIDLGNNFNASRLENVQNMFMGTPSTSGNYVLNLGNNFNLSKANILNYMFYNMGNNMLNFTIKFGNNFNASNVTSISNYAFYSFNNISNLTLDLGDNFNAKRATSLASMFGSISARNSVTINMGNNFNSINVTDMSRMFENTGRVTTKSSSAFTLNLGNNFDTSNVTNMVKMFASTAMGSTTININLPDSFNTINVTNFDSMFYNVGYNSTTVRINLGNNFDTSNATSTQSMFELVAGSASSVNLILGNKLDIGNVVNAQRMFTNIGRNATSAVSLNLGPNFNASRVTAPYFMFAGIGHNATTVTLNLGNNFNLASATRLENIFQYAGGSARNYTLEMGDNFNASNATNIIRLFEGMAMNSSNVTINFGKNFNATNVTQGLSMNNTLFTNMAKGTGGSITINFGDNFNANKITSLSNLIYGMGNSPRYIKIDFGNNFNASSVNNVTNMIMLPISANTDTIIVNFGNNFNLKEAKTIANIFDAPHPLNNLTIDFGNNFNISNVTTLANVFMDFGSTTNNVSISMGNNFNAVNTTSTLQMFRNVGNNSRNFSLNLGNNFGGSKATNMDFMFYNVGQNATNFNINLSGFNMSSISSAYYMFHNMGNKATTNVILDLSTMKVPSNYMNMFYRVPVSRTTIYVSNTTTRNWILNNGSTLGATFSSSNVLIK